MPRTAARTLSCNSRFSRNTTTQRKQRTAQQRGLPPVPRHESSDDGRADRADDRQTGRLPHRVLGREHGAHLLQEQREREPGSDAHEHHHAVEQRALRAARRDRLDRRLEHAELDVFRALVCLVRDARLLGALEQLVVLLAVHLVIAVQARQLGLDLGDRVDPTAQVCRRPAPARRSARAAQPARRPPGSARS